MKKILLIAALASLWACEKAEVAPPTTPEAPKYYTVKGERVQNTVMIYDTLHGMHEFSFLVWMCHDTTAFDPSTSVADTLYGIVDWPIEMDLSWNGGDSSLYYIIGYSKIDGAHRYEKVRNGSKGVFTIPALEY